MASSKREANSKVVEMVLKPTKESALTSIFLMGVSGSESIGAANR